MQNNNYKNLQIMIFDDVFYPGNPKRRQEVADLRAEIKGYFNSYKLAWNENANLLNGIFASTQSPSFKDLRLKLLTKDIAKDAVGDCAKEINEVMEDTKGKLDKLVKDVDLEKLLPDGWKEKGCTLDEIGSEKALEIGKKISAAVTGTCGAFLGYYVFTGSMVALSLITAFTGVVQNIIWYLSGAFAGVILGGAVFIIGDAISSAITGAIERKDLKEAIDALKKIRDDVKKSLPNATNHICGITQSIKDGTYRIDNSHVIWRQADGSYVIVELPKTSARSLKALETASIKLTAKDIENCIKFIAA